MQKLLERYLPVFSPPDDAGGAGAGASGAGDAGAAGGAGGNAAAGDSAAAAAAGGAGQAGAGAALPAAPYRPQGLPDTMFGKTDQETIDKLHNSVEGYRKRDSDRGIPDKPEAYQAFELDKVDAAIKPYVAELAKDPLFAEVSKIAMEEKVPVATMQKLVTTLYTKAAAEGILEPLIDVAAERAQLVPESARSLPKDKQEAAIDARMQENEDFFKLLTRPGADGKPQLDPKVAEHAQLMLMDTAAGNQFLEFFRAQMTGTGKAAPLAGGGSGASGANVREALRAEMAAPEMQPGHPRFSREKHDELMDKYRKLVPDQA